jgi:hypothetical protein
MDKQQVEDVLRGHRDVVLDEVCRRLATWADDARAGNDEDAADHLDGIHDLVWDMKTNKEKK